MGLTPVVLSGRLVRRHARPPPAGPARIAEQQAVAAGREGPDGIVRDTLNPQPHAVCGVRMWWALPRSAFAERARQVPDMREDAPVINGDLSARLAGARGRLIIDLRPCLRSAVSRC